MWWSVLERRSHLQTGPVPAACPCPPRRRPRTAKPHRRSALSRRRWPAEFFPKHTRQMLPHYKQEVRGSRWCSCITLHGSSASGRSPPTHPHQHVSTYRSKLRSDAVGARLTSARHLRVPAIGTGSTQRHSRVVARPTPHPTSHWVPASTTLHSRKWAGPHRGGGHITDPVARPRQQQPSSRT